MKELNVKDYKSKRWAKMGKFNIGCHKCTHPMEEISDFNKKRYHRFIKCPRCGAEVRYLDFEGTEMVKTYDGDGNLIDSGLNKI